MQMIAESYRGISLLVEINLDRLLVPLALVVALTGTAMLCTVLYQNSFPAPVYMLQP
ncbi:hypothetical protein [Phaeovulum sp.]|jgi:hypothetical protein|uniref:hypothetical protein n=1 Tax=Phaeovulum sp. TaxID=2934796 RepID=UPI00272FB724|nr:hypothetical protein [Phaeovulum sp.]MDP1670214.1 hypothetical protein [Phaeovulum sp.]MDP2062821.1 hypothetical protein [Phaeovulum sp.]MDP3861310.1 hypothetical protein [Phaeovulum sp.]MDZ4120290.1 hypothetical protein [Phaeovulum sp.]